MKVRADEVAIGEFFMGTDRELRKVVRITTDAQGRAHVGYQRKSATVPNQPLLFGHTQADPPLLEDFVALCAYRLSGPELDALRERGILLQHE